MSTATEETVNDSAVLSETPVKPSAALVRSLDGNEASSPFASESAYELAKRMATALAQSSIVPSEYRGSPHNCLIALEMANRTGAGVMMVMQNLFPIQGRPSWSAAFVTASVNSCGRFTPLRYRFAGERGKDNWSCTAYATELATGETLDGEPITWEMARKEGWTTRKDSKWQSMPGQMMRYRSAAFWARAYCPEILLGMHTVEENEDITGATVQASLKTRDLNAALDEAEEMRAEIVTE